MRSKLTPEMIVAAMAEYDRRHRQSADDAGTSYVLIHAGKHYPPKRIVRLAVGPDRALSGGEGPGGANTILRSLGFVVEPARQGFVSANATPRQMDPDARLSDPPPTMDALLDQLFAQRWAVLHSHYERVVDGRYPGVYVLACDIRDLTGQPVKESDIYYVGMTQSSLRHRLDQFVRSLDGADLHSAGVRYHRDICHGIAYSTLSHRPTFFLATVAIPCIADKEARQPLDLRKLGEVARLEPYVPARIKEKTGNEPELNKK